MKRPIKQFFHYYIYDMKLKKKLALSFAILFMLPTLTVTFFLFTRIFRIVLNDTLRSEEAFHSQSALAAENLMIHVAHASDTLTYSLPIQRLFSITKKTGARSRPVTHASEQSVSAGRYGCGTLFNPHHTNLLR